MRMTELFHDETPSPLAPRMSLFSSSTYPPLATTLAPRDEKAIVLHCASKGRDRS